MEAPKAFLVNADDGTIVKPRRFNPFPMNDAKLYNKQLCWSCVDKSSTPIKFTNPLGCIINFIEESVIFSNDPTKQYPINDDWYLLERDDRIYSSEELAESYVNKVTVKPRHLYDNTTKLYPIDSVPQTALAGKVYYCIIGMTLLGPLTNVSYSILKNVTFESSNDIDIKSKNIPGLTYSIGKNIPGLTYSIGKWKIKYDGYRDDANDYIGSQKWYMVDENKTTYSLVYEKTAPTVLTQEQNTIRLSLIQKAKERKQAEANGQPTSSEGGSRKTKQRRSKKPNKRKTNRRRH